jgi:Na+-translocating ferredoxin:NAD+ oxidoreductase subunit G
MTGGHHHHGAPAALEPARETPAWKLLATLAVAGAAAGLLVVSVYRVTLPAIQKYAGQKVEGAVREVLKSPARWDTLYLMKGVLVATPPAAADKRELTKAFVGFDDGGHRIGVAITADGPGFQETMSLMIGFDPGTGALTGIKVLVDTETPGLGDKIENDPSFLAQFAGRIAPVAGVRTKPRDGTSEVQTITGATISSRAVIRIVDAAIARWRPMVLDYDKGGAR